MFTPSIKELVILAVIITVLSYTGLWDRVIRGIRELRGERVEQRTPPSAPPDAEVDLSCKMLGVPRGASFEEIEKAYRKKAQLHHPDRGGDGDAMRALNDAYTILKRINQRRG